GWLNDDLFKIVEQRSLVGYPNPEPGIIGGEALRFERGEPQHDPAQMFRPLDPNLRRRFDTTVFITELCDLALLPGDVACRIFAANCRDRPAKPLRGKRKTTARFGVVEADRRAVRVKSAVRFRATQSL